DRTNDAGPGWAAVPSRGAPGEHGGVRDCLGFPANAYQGPTATSPSNGPPDTSPYVRPLARGSKATIRPSRVRANASEPSGVVPIASTGAPVGTVHIARRSLPFTTRTPSSAATRRPETSGRATTRGPIGPTPAWPNFARVIAADAGPIDADRRTA